MTKLNRRVRGSSVVAVGVWGGGRVRWAYAGAGPGGPCCGARVLVQVLWERKTLGDTKRGGQTAPCWVLHRPRGRPVGLFSSSRRRRDGVLDWGSACGVGRAVAVQNRSCPDGF